MDTQDTSAPPIKTKRASFSNMPAPKVDTAVPPPVSLPVDPPVIQPPVVEAPPPNVDPVPNVSYTSMAQPAVSQPQSVTPVAPPVVQPVATPISAPVIPVAAPVVQPSVVVLPPPVMPVVTPPSSVPVAASQVPTKKPPMKKKGSFLKSVVIGLIACLLMGGVGTSFWYYWNSRQKLTALQKASPQVYNELETQSLVEKVARHIDLPNEIPTITTVTDAASMKKEEFFAKAQDGDKVLVFSRRAILYDPVRDRVVEIGFIRQVSPTPVAEASPSGQVAGVATASAIIKTTPKVLLKSTGK